MSTEALKIEMSKLMDERVSFLGFYSKIMQISKFQDTLTKLNRKLESSHSAYESELSKLRDRVAELEDDLVVGAQDANEQRALAKVGI